MMRNNQFREDLFYRINVIPIALPPLRDRREDIPLICEHFLVKYTEQMGKQISGISKGAMDLLVQHDWPGNIRELENVIERALVLGTSDDILPEDLPESLLDRGPAPGIEEASYHAAIKDLKKKLIRKALDEAGGSYVEAARSLGVHPNYLHRLIRNLDMKETLTESGAKTGAKEG